MSFKSQNYKNFFLFKKNEEKVCFFRFEVRYFRFEGKYFFKTKYLTYF